MKEAKIKIRIINMNMNFLSGLLDTQSLSSNETINTPTPPTPPPSPSPSIKKEYIKSIQRVYETCYNPNNEECQHVCSIIFSNTSNDILNKRTIQRSEMKLLRASEILDFCLKFDYAVPLHILQVTSTKDG